MVQIIKDKLPSLDSNHVGYIPPGWQNNGAAQANA